MATETHTANAPDRLDRVEQAIESCRSNPVTNGWLIRQGYIPCETNPTTGGLSRTVQEAHAIATLTVSGKGYELRHVCGKCAQEFYKHRPVKEGIHWS